MMLSKNMFIGILVSTSIALSVGVYLLLVELAHPPLKWQYAVDPKKHPIIFKDKKPLKRSDIWEYLGVPEEPHLAKQGDTWVIENYFIKTFNISYDDSGDNESDPIVKYISYNCYFIIFDRKYNLYLHYIKI